MSRDSPKGLLVFFHCGTNNGYSIAMWEQTFLKMAMNIVGDLSRVHFAYTSLQDGPPKNVPSALNIVRFDSSDRNPDSIRRISDYIREHSIQLGFGFDQPVWRPAYRALRIAGMRTMLSYWGAPMSDIKSGLTLLAKRIEVRLSRYQPDYYVFQNAGMARTATHGRGIPPSRTVVCWSGVDTARFSPNPADPFYAHKQFGIPHTRRIVHYSGHMERRKGIHVVMQAAIELIERRGRRDVHFLLVGNRDGVERPYEAMIAHSPAASHVTFGGYRPDVHRLLQSAHLGVIATTGWDSFPVSGMEMAASGLPLLVSDLPGVNELVLPGITGFRFPTGDSKSLASAIESYLDSPDLRKSHSDAARQRMLRDFTSGQLVDRLTRICAHAWEGRLDGRVPIHTDTSYLA